MAIELCEAKRFIRSLPWPKGTRPNLAFFQVTDAQGREGLAVALYRPEKRFSKPVSIHGPSPEGSLYRALEKWVVTYNLPPTLAQGLARALLN